MKSMTRAADAARMQPPAPALRVAPRRSRAGRALARMFAAFVVLALAIGLPATAFAHAALGNAVPADGAMLAGAPATAELMFSEPVAPIALRLIAPDGSSRTLAAALHDTVLSVALPADMGQGTYALSWRVVSEDGHPVGGTLTFSIGHASAGAPAVAAAAVDWPLRAAIWTARFALYAGLFLGVGGVVFAAWLLPRGGPAPRGGQGGADVPARGFLSVMLAVGIVALVPALGLQGADLLGAPVTGLAQPEIWQAGLGGIYARTLALAAAALLIAAVSLLAVVSRRPVVARLLSAAALAALGLALAASGHASTATPQAVMRAGVFLHAVTIAVWVGSLVPLAVLFRRGARRDGNASGRADDANRATGALRRFSAVIPWFVAVLVLSGGTLAVVQLGHPSALWTTDYGRVMLAKFALLSLLFAFALLNRVSLTAPALRGEQRAAGLLARSIAVETVLVVAIFAVVAVWRFTPPPRAIDAARNEPAAVHIHTAEAMADITVTPGHAGPVSASIVVMTGDFGPLDPQEITLALSNRGAGIEPIRRSAARVGDGTWRVDGLVLPVPGQWTVQLRLLISDFRMATLDGEVDIKP